VTNGRKLVTSLIVYLNIDELSCYSAPDVNAPISADNKFEKLICFFSKLQICALQCEIIHEMSYSMKIFSVFLVRFLIFELTR
jgi:hypothetical protein